MPNINTLTTKKACVYSICGVNYKRISK